MPLRLALYSDVDHADNAPMHRRLLRLIGAGRPRIGYVASSPDPERVHFDRHRDHYADLGASLACYVDEHADDAAFAALLDCDAIHLSGGETFEFLAWLQRRACLPALRAYARERGVLVGMSAGAILMTPDIRSAAWCGDREDVALADTRGLGLVPFSFLPHAGSAHETLRVPTPDMLAGRPSPLYACPDGSGLVVVDGEIEVFGAPIVVRASARQAGCSAVGVSGEARHRPVAFKWGRDPGNQQQPTLRKAKKS